MIGWRGRIGLIIPSVNTVAEYECPKLVPHGVSVHFARMYLPEVKGIDEKERALSELSQNAVRAAIELSSIKPKVIAFCCTAGSFIKGEDYNNEIIKKIQEKVNINTITTTSAVIKAFQILNLAKISMVTPYNDELAEKAVCFFEKAIKNFKVLRVKNLGIIEALPKGNLLPHVAYNYAKEVDLPEAEAIFISCTNFRTREIIDFLEEELCKPVITSNQATMWAALKEMGISGMFSFGKLLKEYL